LPPVKALPFSIEEVMFSDMFKGGLKLAKVYVQINGGSPQEWAATSVSIAEKVATFGADAIEVSVRRDDIRQASGVMYREVAHAFHHPNPDRQFSPKEKRWAIYAADPTHMATQRDIDAVEEFNEINGKLFDKGMNAEAADKRAVAMTIKKYHLSKSWHPPLGNVWMNNDGIPRDSMNIDISTETDSLAALSRCMDGKIIRTFSTCEE
jgi:hypothetical protein